MGVLGLSTYLRENRRLSEAHRLDTRELLADRIKIVVDGWSFIYDLYRSSGLPWVYGGEYAAFGRLVRTVVEAWVRVGLEVSFVFDGPCPELKFPTVVSRLTQTNVTNALVFFRTSSSSRANSRFLHESRIIPPLVYTACIECLNTLPSSINDHVFVHYADEEGDPYAVELAGRIGAFVAGSDSDFVILNAPGYRGYIPLDEMIWSAAEAEEAVAQDDDFQPVRKPKSHKRAFVTSGRGLVPPADLKGLSLAFTSYSPTTLAAHLNLPITLLPLMGALVGNDLSNSSSSSGKNVQLLFFERGMSHAQRITRVTATINSILSASSLKGKQEVEGVMDLIDKTVTALLIRSISTMGSGEVEKVVDRIVEATLQYALHKSLDDSKALWPTSICALHLPEVCPILPMMSRMERYDIREAYLQAYRRGCLNPKILDLLQTGTSWPRLFLEVPDLETVSRALGRPIRQWGYAILHDALGLPCPEADLDEQTIGTDAEAVDEDDEEELVDVVESDSDEESTSPDLLAPLRGALQSLQVPEDAESHISDDRIPVVTEFLRRGTRIAEEPVAVPMISDLLASISCSAPGPVACQSEAQRLTVLLRALRSDSDAVRTLPRRQLGAAVCLRWIIMTLHERASESKDRDKERWTRREALCFLAAHELDSDPSESDNSPELLDRNIQLTAQALTCIEAVDQLSQILLISHLLPSIAPTFSGMAFHRRLTGVAPPTVSQPLSDACLVDLSYALADERKKKIRKTKGSGRSASVPANPATGLFGLLANADA
ncbi:unnamed protein product [Mycena citricolor]|uniref:Asteroid domain-containing protein n=1 Tax=Mycena citricolor TaxID=2018698 RepID=A0AAD2K711_9AGAR|nr:unnamed protein product [Mycena citricolor]CAK5282428.1 unnamed protein product [Mycena citricolor]